MSSIDPEVLYLILTKVAGKQTVYGFDANVPPSGQKPGTITRLQLAEVHERITGNRVGARLNWDTPIGQLDALLAKCGLPALRTVVEPLNEALLIKVHATQWPAFSALKNLYMRKK